MSDDNSYNRSLSNQGVNHNSNQVKYLIISNFKIIEYLFLLISLKVKTSIFVFGMMLWKNI